MSDRKKDMMKEVGAPADQIRESVGKKIRQERDRRSQSAERVAARLGISRVALTHIEKGRKHSHAVQLWNLACIFGCAPSDFFPPIPEGWALTPVEYKKIANEDERAEEWARNLFSDEF